MRAGFQFMNEQYIEEDAVAQSQMAFLCKPAFVPHHRRISAGE